MTGTRIGLVVGLAVAALAVAGCGGDDEVGAGTTDTETTTTATTPVDGSTLAASVGPGFEISLTGADGEDATTLSAGAYTIDVDDQSGIHNFHLTGPSVDESTEVSGTGTDSWNVTLAEGTYSFVCDPHAGTMSGNFEVSG
jgi:plastocyanin